MSPHIMGTQAKPVGEIVHNQGSTVMLYELPWEIHNFTNSASNEMVLCAEIFSELLRPSIVHLKYKMMALWRVCKIWQILTAKKPQKDQFISYHYQFLMSFISFRNS